MTVVNCQTPVRDYIALKWLLMEYKPKTIYEIGTCTGHSTVFFADLLPETQIWTIDIIDNFFTHPHSVGDEIKIHPARGRITMLIGDSQNRNFVHTNVPSDIDFAFIDGGHSYNDALRDSVVTYPLIVKRGIICWHDAVGWELAAIKDFCFLVGITPTVIEDSMVAYAIKE